MKVKVLGYKKVVFNANDGSTINGYSVYFFYPAVSPDSKGYLCDRYFLTAKKFDDFDIKNLAKNQTDCEILYNRYGKIEEIR